MYGRFTYACIHCDLCTLCLCYCERLKRPKNIFAATQSNFQNGRENDDICHLLFDVAANSLNVVRCTNRMHIGANRMRLGVCVCVCIGMRAYVVVLSLNFGFF